jgi:excisionase family DNA binding protein
MTTPLANITTRQVADLAYVDPSTVRRWVEQGKLTPSIVTPGGQYRFNEADVRRQLSPTPSLTAQEAS